MNRNLKQFVICFGTIILGFALIIGLSNFLDRNRPPLPENYEDEDLALQGAKLKNYSLGFNGLIADWYWMKSLQYIGDKVFKNKNDRLDLEDLRPLNPRLLYPLLDNATTLDPNFMAVYAYGAVVLPAISAEQAIKIAEKGIANNPNEWRLYQHLGYIYWRLKNFEKAAQIYEKGSKIDGAPPFMLLMFAQMKSKGGSRETARALYQQMLDDAQESRTLETAKIRLMELDWLDERDAIRNALQTFKSKNNRCANNWSEVFHILKSLKLSENKDFRIDRSNNLVDPSGVPYLLDRQKCDVLLDAGSTKIPLQ